MSIRSKVRGLESGLDFVSESIRTITEESSERTPPKRGIYPSKGLVEHMCLTILYGRGEIHLGCIKGKTSSRKTRESRRYRRKLGITALISQLKICDGKLKRDKEEVSD